MPPVVSLPELCWTTTVGTVAALQCPRFPLRPIRPGCLLLVAGLLLAGGAGSLRADDRVTVRGKASPEYVAWKFGGADGIKNESYVFMPGRFFGGTTRDRVLEKMQFIDIAKSLANDLVGQHYYPADAVAKANLLIIVEWGVTTVADSNYKLLARDNPMGAGDTDAATRESMHQMAQSERDNGAPTPMVQMMDQGYEMSRMNGLASDAEFQELDQKAMSLGLASNAELVGFADDLKADNESPFGTAQGAMLRSFMTDERYFVALLAYDCQVFLTTKKFQLVWSMRLSMRAPGMDFRAGVSLMSTAGRTEFGHRNDSVEVKQPHEKSAHVEIRTPVVIEMDAGRKTEPKASGR